MKGPEAPVPGIVRTILSRLKGFGFEAYVVGGAVRDMVLGRNPTDWDVATSASSVEVRDLFPNLTSFSLQHGALTLVHEGRHYEVSTFRGALPTLEDDLAHRDFTVNAMAWELEDKKLIDPWGGCRDVALKLVRAVGIPEDRFREDPLRILRALRISCELDFGIHRKTRHAMSGMAPMLSMVARERIRDELLKILLSKKPSLGFREMLRTNLLKEIVPELQTIFGHTMETVDRVPPNAALRLAALFHDIAKPGVKDGHEIEEARIAEEVMRRLRFSERMILQVAHLVRHHTDDTQYASSWNDGEVRRFVRELGPEHLEAFFCLRRADLESWGKDTRPLCELEERARIQIIAGFPCRVQDLKVDGRKVMEICGTEAGPEVGRILGALLEEVLDHPEWNTEEKLTELLEKMSRDRAMDR